LTDTLNLYLYAHLRIMAYYAVSPLQEVGLKIPGPYLYMYPGCYIFMIISSSLAIPDISGITR
jgi:hypothetical protein